MTWHYSYTPTPALKVGRPGKAGHRHPLAPIDSIHPLSTMASLFRRGFASSAAIASEAASAVSTAGASSAPAPSRTASTLPQKIRARRAQFPTSPSLHGERERLSPAQERRFQAAFDRGEITRAVEGEGEGGGGGGDGATKVVSDMGEARRVWIARHDEWRSRVRGHNQVLREPVVDTFGATDASANASANAASGPRLSSRTPPALFTGPDTLPDAASLAAHRIYLPNIQIRLMRNHTPPGEPYDPFTATFRIPPSMTKHDLRAYLHAVYGLAVTFIRTDNYVAPVARIGPAGQMRRAAGSAKTYKRAVVGLREPFHYPDDTDELDALVHAAQHDAPSEGYEGVPRELRIEAAERAKEGREQRREWLNRNFAVDMQASGRKRSMMKMAKGWRWRAETSDNKVGRAGPGVVVWVKSVGADAGVLARRATSSARLCAGDRSASRPLSMRSKSCRSAGARCSRRRLSGMGCQISCNMFKLLRMHYPCHYFHSPHDAAH